jgi:hypothetical protein
MRLVKRVLLAVFLLSGMAMPQILYGQQDTTQTPQPEKKALPPPHYPKRAALMSAVIPGLGQAYNHKYWKIPVIYIAGAGLGYLLYYEQHKFDFYTGAYHQSVTNQQMNYPPTYRIDPSIAGWDTGQLLEWKNYYNRYRDLSFIGCTAVYLLNILDATVDAHLWHFKERVNDDLSFRISPSAIPVIGYTLPAPGIHLSLSIR